MLADDACPLGPSYAMAFIGTMHEWIGHVRFPALRLDFGTTGSCLKLAQTCRLSRCSNSRQLLRVLQTIKSVRQATHLAIHPCSRWQLAAGGRVLFRALRDGCRVAATNVSRVWDRHRKADRGRELPECAVGRPRP